MLPSPTFGQIGENAICYEDYATLKKGHYLTGSTINWCLKQLTLDFPNANVTVLSTDFYVRLSPWSPDHKDQRLAEAVDQIQISPNENRIIVLPACCRSHFYILVAVMDLFNPLLFILESLGGPVYGKEPPHTDKFLLLLKLRTENRNLVLGKFQKHLPVVPRQPFLSNNCGIFAVKFVELLLRDPHAFVESAHQNKLGAMFLPNSLNSKRDEIAVKVNTDASNQRLPGAPLCNNPIPLPLPSPDWVWTKVLEFSARLIIILLHSCR